MKIHLKIFKEPQGRKEKEHRVLLKYRQQKAKTDHLSTVVILSRLSEISKSTMTKFAKTKLKAMTLKYFPDQPQILRMIIIKVWKNSLNFRKLIVKELTLKMKVTKERMLKMIKVKLTIHKQAQTRKDNPIKIT